MNIIQKNSPNYKEGRGIYKPEIIVLHIMNGTLSGTDSWFGSIVSQVSAHYGIGLTGEIHQYVQDENTAWANGIVNLPSFKLYKPGVNPNMYTLSIEHEGYDLAFAPDSQLSLTTELIQALAGKWAIPIDRDHIIGHYEIDRIRKPNCPAVNKTVIDTIVKRAQTQSDYKQKIKDAINILQSAL